MRDHRMDNAKGLLIFLVVLGHCLEAVKGWEDPIIRGLLTAIYMFHMPAFVFLAGITAKQDQLGRRIANLAIILVLFQLAYVVPVTIKDGTSPVGPLQPYWALWFLLSMVWWLALLPLIVRLPFPLLISTAVAVGAGLLSWAGYPLSVSRTLVFLPFFVAGQVHGRRLMAMLPSSPLWAVPAVLGLASMATVLYVAEIGHPWLSGYANFDVLNTGGLPAIAIRGGLILIAAASTYAVLVASSAKAGWLSSIGSASMAVFLLHGFLLMAGGGRALRWVSTHHGAIAVLGAAVVVAALITVVLGRGSIDRYIRNVSAWILNRSVPILAR
ncbi:acyltransferase family protein [Pseudomonas sp. LB3P31]